MKSRSSQANPERVLVEETLRNDRIEFSCVPEFGCHWTRLRVSVKGRWVDFLSPVRDCGSLPDGGGGAEGSFLMAPWSNRIARASFEFRGRRHELRSNFRDGTAIHGDVRRRPWIVTERDRTCLRAFLDSRETDDFNYPFRLRFCHALELEADSLRATLTVENVDDEPAPVGLGLHPYLLRRLTPRDQDVMLVVPAERVYPAVNCIPIGLAQPVEGRTDLRGPQWLGNPGLDHCYTGLADDHIRFIYPGTRCEVRFLLDPAFTHVVVYTPRGGTGEALDCVAVEPVTNANDGFNLLARGIEGAGVRVLEPGERWSATCGISVGDL